MIYLNKRIFLVTFLIGVCAQLQASPTTFDLNKKPTVNMLGAICYADGDKRHFTSKDAVWLAKVVDSVTNKKSSSAGAEAVLWSVVQRTAQSKWRNKNFYTKKQAKNLKKKWRDTSKLARKAVLNFVNGKSDNSVFTAIGWYSQKKWNKRERNGKNNKAHRIVVSEIDNRVFFTDGRKINFELAVYIVAAGESCPKITNATFAEEENVVPQQIRTDIGKFEVASDKWFDLHFENSQDAVNKFFITVKTASAKSAKPKILNAMLGTIFDLGTTGFDEKYSGGHGAALNIFVNLISAAKSEADRANKSKNSHSMGVWLKKQINTIGKARDSYRKRDIKELLSLGYLEAVNKSNFHKSLFETTQALKDNSPPNSKVLELKLYEKWILANSGYLEVRVDADGSGIEVESFQVKAPAGNKIGSAINQLKINPWKLKLRKKICFYMDAVAGGTKWQCAWLNSNNKITKMPAYPKAKKRIKSNLGHLKATVKYFK